MDPLRHRRLQAAALGRARARGDLRHVIQASVLTATGSCVGWLTLHRDTGDVGFFDWRSPTSDLYLERRSIQSIVRSADATRISYLAGTPTTVDLRASDNDLALWHDPPPSAPSAE
jgi:hypothetical protein